ncbi:MAG: OsmC family protein [Deinococcales bacterium]|jgi:uncharacterized OsmC-like protein
MPDPEPTPGHARIDVAARQDPLRERYRASPDEALITDRARTTEGELGDPVHVWCVPGSQDYGVQWPLGIHEAVGGLHDMPNPGDLLCAALATCLDSVVRMIANRHGVELRSLEVDVQGEVDVRGTLWVSRSVPVGFQRMRCSIRLEPAPGTDPALVERLMTAAEYSCVNLQTLRHGVDVETSHAIVDPGGG